MLDIAVVNTALSAIAADLDTGLSGLQWVVDAYTLALAATVITAGSLADRFGRRRLFVIGLARLHRDVAAVRGVAQSITMLNAARAAQGVGAAIMFAVSLAVLSHAFPRPQERIKALAAYGATMAGRVRDRAARRRRADLRPGLALDLPDQPPARPGVPVDRAPPRRRVAAIRGRRGSTSPACVTLTGALFLLVFALLRGERRPAVSSPARSCSGAAFVAIEARVTQPMLPLRLFRNPSFTGAQVGAVGISGSLFALWLYLTLYLQQVLGLSAIEAGLVFVPGTLLNFVVAGATASLAPEGLRPGTRRGRPRADRRRPRAADGRRRGHVVVAVPARPAGRDGRHGDAQPRRRAGRAELGAAGAERARRRRQRHVPPGRARGRRRRARRADLHRAARRRTSTGSTTRCGSARRWPPRARWRRGC